MNQMYQKLDILDNESKKLIYDQMLYINFFIQIEENLYYTMEV